MGISPLTLIGELTRETCQCGGVMLWRKHRVFSVRWRQECVCGRCGPWRSEPKREPLPIPPGMRNRTNYTPATVRMDVPTTAPRED